MLDYAFLKLDMLIYSVLDALELLAYSADTDEIAAFAQSV